MKFRMGRKQWSLVATAVALAVPIFLFLWTFSLVRELGYWIERGKSELVVDGVREPGKLRVFSGTPREQGTLLPQAGKEFFLIVDLGLHRRVGKDDYRATLAVAGIRYELTSRGLGKDRAMEVRGGKPGKRIVTFVFSSRLKDDADWVRAGLVPDLLVIQWADWPGYLRASLRAELFLEALLLAAFLVFHAVYLRRNAKSVLMPSIRRAPDRNALLTIAVIAAAGLSLYCFPLFHNVVFLWFGFWSLCLWLAWKTWMPESQVNREKPALRELLILVAILLVGMIPRVAHLDWGAPLLMHPDEYAFTSFPPKMAETNSLDPLDFERPNHPSIYTNSMAYGVASQLVFGQALPQAFATHQFFFHLLSRWIVTIWALVAMVACWLVGRQFHPLAGLWAAVLFAVHPGFLEHSHYATPDVPMTAMQLFSIWLSLRYLKSRSWRDLAPSILWVSLASGEKYPGILYLMVPVAAVLWVHRKSWGEAISTLVRLEFLYVAGLFLCAPYVFLKAHMVLLNLISESRPTHLGSDGLSWGGNLAYYLRIHMGQSSWLLLVLAMAGLWVAWRKRGPEALPVLSGIVYWIVVSRLPLHWERWSLPMAISPLLLSALSLGAMTHWIVSRRSRLAWLLPFLAITGTMLIGQAFRCEMVMTRLGSTDTRVAGLAHLSALGLNDRNTIVSQYTSMAPAWKPGFDFVAAATDSEEMRGRRYAFCSESMYGRFLAEAQRYPRETHFYRSLFQRPLLLEIAPSVLPAGSGSAADWELAHNWIGWWRWKQAHVGPILTGPVQKVFDLDPGGVRTSQGLAPTPVM
jgi:Dolichyl-phosphate-mannose-protein mannosyltransferase